MNITLNDDWNLWPDFAVRSSGFPVEGLSVFGPDEDLSGVARDPAFREAVAWQSRESLAHAVDKLAAGLNGSPSRQRRWSDVVAGYWQRYCSKNDTIGFFGPLAWGSFGDAVEVRSGALERERIVHFETWAMEAVGGVTLPMCPFPERALRPLLDDTTGLDRLEAAREAVAAAPREQVAAALDRLDRVFEQVAGRPASRVEGDSGGGRTIAYLDCLRDLDLKLGPSVLEELRVSLPPVLYASRWWCGRVFDRGAELLGAIARPGPLAPQLGALMGAGFGLWNQMADEQRELQRRWAAGDAFADWTPAWHGSRYHSADLQLAAPNADALARGDFLIVLGDFHGGDNPLAQGLFGLRHPSPGGLLRRIAAEAGPGLHLSPPRRGVVEMTARSWPLYPPGDVVVAAGDEPAPAGLRRVDLSDVVVDGGHVTDGVFRVPIAEFLYLPIFVSALRSFDLAGEHERARAGRPARRPPRVLVGARRLAPGRPRGLGARAQAATARFRPLAARAQAALRRLREPVAAPHALPLHRARARAGAGCAGRVHRDAPRPRGLLAGERSRAPHERASRRRRSRLVSARCELEFRLVLTRVGAEGSANGWQ